MKIKSELIPYLNQIHVGKAEEVLPSLPSKSIELVVTSPPYNLRNSSGGGMHNGSGGKWQQAALLKGYQDGDARFDDDMPHEDYVYWQRKVLRECMRVLTDDGAIYYNHKWRVQDGKWQDRSDIVNGLPLPVRQIIIWKRKGGINFNKGYFLPTYEVVYLFAGKNFELRLAIKECGAKSFEKCKISGGKCECGTKLQGANALGDVWEITQEMDNPHPAPFPVELALKCIDSVSGRGAVLDPFMGSGTTAIAAEQCGRPWIGIEISKTYCADAEKRIVDARVK